MDPRREAAVLIPEDGIQSGQQGDDIHGLRAARGRPAAWAEKGRRLEHLPADHGEAQLAPARMGGAQHEIGDSSEPFLQPRVIPIPDRHSHHGDEIRVDLLDGREDERGEDGLSPRVAEQYGRRRHRPGQGRFTAQGD